jgi:hypothetical protein
MYYSLLVDDLGNSVIPRFKDGEESAGYHYAGRKKQLE